MTTRATRFSGDIAISIIHNERERQYACRLAIPGGRSGYQVVGEPAVLEHAVDAPEAIDAAAHAALSFAAEDFHTRSDVEDHAAMTDEGWHIGRTEKERWPCSRQ
jgi:hypothetical protein